MYKSLMVGMATLLFVGCVQTPAGQATAQGGADETLKMAEEKLDMAKKADAEWMLLDKATGSAAVPLTKTLEAAKEKAAAGETEEAIRLANRVIQASELGIEQAKEQKDAGPKFFD